MQVTNAMLKKKATWKEIVIVVELLTKVVKKRVRLGLLLHPKVLVQPVTRKLVPSEQLA